ncbi:hypothetical protein H112_02737 [Trichophyton rubrum D6]|uniref:Uncharacterized protein n=3 Tax=Trichophyton TaxID=5550 RepID=F2SU26_TRIRC|nr:uncharacterized protein TERG_06492 [Trichophyton rubrum CBS 118892]XP_047604614.1 uncharacterized protein TERG_06492 [Trichophyton rubrum CBS 118892]EZF24812.1 hypothetical protein H100_02742 [Trichophyton rubrum MR850]EZF43823.1 hypothetical protein H102_02736 [Trichophyton rubrum CBS 100081]EZF54464.1 hypothetical protein H103_02747 [Trichophyton rubrum CBS 288.86]EZF65137.1 hypothetical protein H104_02726 [Trichophyton rubrum CBS 289.86]EZF75804.1 hypothetical protein H105_02753 [Tricho
MHVRIAASMGLETRVPLTFQLRQQVLPPRRVRQLRNQLLHTREPRQWSMTSLIPQLPTSMILTSLTLQRFLPLTLKNPSDLNKACLSLALRRILLSILTASYDVYLVLNVYSPLFLIPKLCGYICALYVSGVGNL